MAQKCPAFKGGRLAVLASFGILESANQGISDHAIMDSEIPGKIKVSAEPASSGLSMARRRLFRGAAGGVGVLLTVHAKTALGGVCKSPSAMMSGNTSPRAGDGSVCSGGRSPGFWKVPQKFQFWGPAGATPPTFSVGVSECASGMQNLKLDHILTQGTLLTSAGFAGAPLNVGIWAVLAFPNNFSGGQLLRHLSAAWLNAEYFSSPTQHYPVPRAQIFEMWNATKSGGLYCPGTVVGGCGSNGWSAEKVIAYFEGMYDINDGVGPDLCTS